MRMESGSDATHHNPIREIVNVFPTAWPARTVTFLNRGTAIMISFWAFQSGGLFKTSSLKKTGFFPMLLLRLIKSFELCGTFYESRYGVIADSFGWIAQHEKLQFC